MKNLRIEDLNTNYENVEVQINLEEYIKLCRRVYSQLYRFLEGTELERQRAIESLIRDFIAEYQRLPNQEEIQMIYRNNSHGKSKSPKRNDHGGRYADSGQMKSGTSSPRRKRSYTNSGFVIRKRLFQVDKEG